MKQVKTVSVSVTRVMGSPDFALGVDEVRDGHPFDWRRDDWDYERGRLFGRIAPIDMPLRNGRRLNPKAVALYVAASRRSLII